MESEMWNGGCKMWNVECIYLIARLPDWQNLQDLKDKNQAIRQFNKFGNYKDLRFKIYDVRFMIYYL